MGSGDGASGNGGSGASRNSGSGAQRGGGDGSRPLVEPAAWARSVCASLAPWRTQLTALTDRTQRQLTSATPAVTAKKNLIGLLDGAAAASETARRGVVGAGIPHVDSGVDIAARFVASLAAARDAYAHASGTVADLDPADERAFYAAVGTAFEQLQREYATSALDTDRISSGPLRAAFNEVPECH
ncbi:MAG: hypothetical protein QOE03_3411 [Micromonosporaceae bacterium]|nr:hypothetical protein [Micromonosporaceae bacterium]